MKALILAAGFGTRLKPLTDKTPKPLIPVSGVPMILYTLALLKKNGILDVVINLHHLGKQIKKYLGNGKKFGMKIRYSEEPKILGTGGGIKKAARLMSDPFLVINGDIICDLNIKKLIAQHLKQASTATLVLRKARDAKKYGLLDFKNGKLLSILGKPQQAGEKGHFTGVHIINKKILRRIAPHQFACIVTDAYIPALVSGENLGAFAAQNYWNDCGTFAAIKSTELALRQKKLVLSYKKILSEFAENV